MTRREMLTRVFGAVIAAAVAPLIDLTDQTPAFWNQEPIWKLWRITFPDGVTWSFNGHVIAEKLSDDGILSLTVAMNETGSMMFIIGPLEEPTP